VGDQSVSEPVGASTVKPEQAPPTADTVVGDQPVSEPLGTSAGNLEQARPTADTVVGDQPVSEPLGASTDNLEQAPPTADIPVPTRPSVVASTAAANQPPPAKSTWSMGKWLSLPGAEWVAEKWFARRASHELLDLHERIHREEPQLTGRTLYERVVVLRSGLDVKAAAGVLRRAEQSFCDWPSGRDLRFLDLVLYVVVDEYLRSHVATLGTQTNMGKIVARVIPADL
jgi:hypothetical protein